MHTLLDCYLFPTRVSLWPICHPCPRRHYLRRLVGTSGLYHLAKMGWTDCVAGEERIDQRLDGTQRNRPNFRHLVDHETAVVLHRDVRKAR